MSIKTQDELLQELQAAVRTGGQGGKTTAAEVRAFLTSLTQQLYERTQAGAEASRPFLFQVNALTEPGHYHLAALTVEQVRQLVQQDVAQVTVLSEARGGHQHEISFGYDHQQATFTVLGIVRAGGEVVDAGPQEEGATHEVLLIGRAGGSGTGAGSDKAVAFKVGSIYNPEHYHMAYLTWEQAAQLVQNQGMTLELDTDEQDGHRVRIQVWYDHQQNYFTGRMLSSTNGNQHVVTQTSIPAASLVLQDTGSFETGYQQALYTLDPATSPAYTPGQEISFIYFPETTWGGGGLNMVPVSPWQGMEAGRAGQEVFLYQPENSQFMSTRAYGAAPVLYEQLFENGQYHPDNSLWGQYTPDQVLPIRINNLRWVGSSRQPGYFDLTAATVNIGNLLVNGQPLASNQASLDALQNSLNTALSNQDAPYVGWGFRQSQPKYFYSMKEAFEDPAMQHGIVVCRKSHPEAEGDILNTVIQAFVGNGCTFYPNGHTVRMPVAVYNTRFYGLSGRMTPSNTAGSTSLFVGTTFYNCQFTNVTLRPENRTLKLVECTANTLYGYNPPFTEGPGKVIFGNGVIIQPPLDPATTIVREQEAGGAGAGGPASSTLEFVFEAGFTDEVTRTMGSNQAATYQSQQLQNVASVTYRLNGAAVALPLTVAAGDTLQVLISRSAAASAAVVTLAS